jgi:hypothetical protein
MHGVTRSLGAVNGLRLCIVMQLPPGDLDQVAEKRRTLPLREVDSLAFSFQSLVKIDNLTGITALRTLKLDCNRITRIENLDHLVCTFFWHKHCTQFCCATATFSRAAGVPDKH